MEKKYTYRDYQTLVSTQDEVKQWNEEQPIGQHEWRLVRTNYQEKGRGQKGNGWEAECDKNLLMSLHCQPTFLKGKNQFLLSEAIALALYDVLKLYVPIQIKWPNDIYVGEKKLGGILIECNWKEGHLSDAFIGIGLNVNQKVFMSDAPNPISLVLLSPEKEWNIEELMWKIVEAFEKRYRQLEDQDIALLQYDYRSVLFRGSGCHSYRLPNGKELIAKIKGVDASGMLHLCDREDKDWGFMFKEIMFVL